MAASVRCEKIGAAKAAEAQARTTDRRRHADTGISTGCIWDLHSFHYKSSAAKRQVRRRVLQEEEAGRNWLLWLHGTTNQSLVVGALMLLAVALFSSFYREGFWGQTEQGNSFNICIPRAAAVGHLKG